MPAGRPRKNGRKEPYQFVRALEIYDAYQSARKRGEKHSIAVREAARVPRFHASESEVRRVLAEFRSVRHSDELNVDSYVRSDADIARHRFLMSQVPEDRKSQPTLREPTDETRPKVGFRFGFVNRTKYPRFNAKSLK
jgi:hypothetical protein